MRNVLVDAHLQRHRPSVVVFGMLSAAFEVRLHEMVTDMRRSEDDEIIFGPTAHLLRRLSRVWERIMYEIFGD